MKLKVLLTLLVVLPVPVFATGVPVPTAPVVGALGEDLSAEYQDRFARNLPLDYSRLQSVRTLFVPGLMADMINKRTGYFKEQLAAFKAAGLERGKDFDLVLHQSGFSGQRDAASNSRALREEILKSPKPVLLVSHSKGGVDVLVTLMQYPELRRHIAGWLSLQGAFGGSVFADAVMAKRVDRYLARKGLEAYGGNIQALIDMTQPLRAEFLAKHERDIESLPRDFPVITLTTWQQYSKLPTDLRILNYTRDKQFRTRPSDGILEVKNALLPAMPWIFLPGVDHAETNTSGHGKFERVRFLNSLLYLVLDRMARQ